MSGRVGFAPVVMLCAMGVGTVAAHKSERPWDVGFDEQVRTAEVGSIVALAQAARTFHVLGGPFPGNVGIPRALHPKTLGCYSGIFMVNTSLEEKYRRGIFRRAGQNYTAMLRLSERGFGEFDTALGVSMKMFDVPGDTINPDFAPADEKKTMDFISFASALLTHTRLGSESPGLEGVPKECEAALDSQKNEVFKAAQLNSLGRDLNGFRNELLSPSANFTSPQHYDFTATGQVAYQFGKPNEPAYKWFWTGPKIPTNCAENARECITVAGFQKAFQKAFTAASPKFELSLWGHLQGDKDEVEIDTCWGSSEPVLLGKWVMEKDEQKITCERARFTPWHSPEEHRPLGNIGRARGPVYRQVQEARGSLPCNSIDECRNNGLTASAPYRISQILPAFRAALDVIPLRVSQQGFGVIFGQGSQDNPMLDTDRSVDSMMCEFFWLPVIFGILIPCIILCSLCCYFCRKGRKATVPESVDMNCPHDAVVHNEKNQMQPQDIEWDGAHTNAQAQIGRLWGPWPGSASVVSGLQRAALSFKPLRLFGANKESLLSPPAE